jgi:very-short-patch-repair endonuclease
LVLVPIESGRQSFARARVRRTRRLPRGLPGRNPALAPVARAVADHAHTLVCLNDVRAVVAEAVQREWCTVQAIAAELAAGGRNGSALLRQAVTEIAGGARSAPEAEAAAILREGGVHGFQQNVDVLACGRRFNVDFLWEQLMAVLEIDSQEFHFRSEQWKATMERHAMLEAAGYSVIHVPPSALKDRCAFIELVASWLQTRGRTLALR